VPDDDRYTVKYNQAGGRWDIQVPVPGHPGMVVEAEHSGREDKAREKATALADEVAANPDRWAGV
jgi:hypothetical protein